jgi:AraC-like DNA-binding protein
MDVRGLIWVDLRLEPSEIYLSNLVRASYPLQYVREPGGISGLVAALSPAAICFEYDKPGPKELEPLRRTRLKFPGLPVLLITVDHSEELAVWALMMKVSDYLVVPVEVSDLFLRIAALVNWRTANQLPGTPLDQEFPEFEPIPNRGDNHTQACDRLLPALTYVEANYSEKVALGVVAQLCGLGRYQFSRAFKQAHGTTFREFLIVHRINKAMQMLKTHGASITDVAFSVGFNDLSHFAQMFRRYVGVCPSEYLQGLKNEHNPTPDSFGNLRSFDRAVQNPRTPLQQNPSST